MPVSDGSPIDVLVIGAGPTGLMLAAELLRHGVSCRLIEKLPEPQPYAKASGVMPRTLEVLEDVGLLKAFLEVGMPVRAFVICKNGSDEMLHMPFSDLDCPHPMLLGIEQYSTERLLTAHLHGMGGAIERGTELVAFADADDAVKATLRHGDSREETVRAAYVVGCDGAHSTVRHALNLTFEGEAYDLDFLLGHTRIDWKVPRDESWVFLSPQGSMFCFPVPEERWMFVAELAGEQKSRHHAGEPTEADLQQILDERGPAGARVHDTKWTSFFRVNHRQVNRYRVGRAFVAGDAAHIHSPAGGQGMNTGLQDAYNLGWKLAAVLRHGAAPALLDSYEAERRPVGKAVLGLTDRMQTMMAVRNPAIRELRDAAMRIAGHVEVVAHHMAGQIGETLYSYHSGPLAGEHHDLGFHLHHDARHPGFRDCAEFLHGPRGGDRAPDAALNGTRVFEHLRGTHFTALLFEGTHGAQAEEADLMAEARAIEQAHPELIQAFVVTPHAEPPAALAGDERVLTDPDQHTHHRYGARGQCLYLIRPDGYVAFRSQPPGVAYLGAYLNRIGLRSPLA